MQNDIAVISANIGNFDTLYSPQVDGSFHVVTDTAPQKGWHGLNPQITGDNRTISRHPKMQPWRYINAKVWIWHDAGLILRRDIDELLSVCDPTADICAPRHKNRDCITAHAFDMVRIGKDNAHDATDTIQSLERQGLIIPRYGLHECGLMVIRNTDKARLALSKWWELYNSLPSKRDQLTFDIACRLTGAKVSDIPGNYKTGEWVIHSRKRGER